VPGRKAVRIELGDCEHAELEARARRRKTSRGDAMRASIGLLAASGMANLAIAKRLGVTVAAWRKRFVARRMADEPRPGAPRKSGDELVLCIDEKSQIQTLDRRSRTAWHHLVVRHVGREGRGPSSASACRGTEHTSSAGSSTLLRRRPPSISTSTSSWTMGQCTKL
jgi:hypothetical protein